MEQLVVVKEIVQFRKAINVIYVLLVDSDISLTFDVFVCKNVLIVKIVDVLM